MLTMFLFARSVSPPGSSANIESYWAGAKRSSLFFAAAGACSGVSTADETAAAGPAGDPVSICANVNELKKEIKSDGANIFMMDMGGAFVKGV